MPADGNQKHPQTGVLALIGESQLPAMVPDPAQRAVLDVNPSFEAEYGWAPEAIVGRNYRDLIADDDVDAVRRLLSLASFGEDPEPVVVRFWSRDATLRKTKWQAVPNVGDDRGRPPAVICRPMPGGVGVALEPPDLFQEMDEKAPEELGWDVDEQDSRDDHSRSLWD